MNNVLVGLGWDARPTDGRYFDLDASAFMLKVMVKLALMRILYFIIKVRSASESVEKLGPVMMSHCYYN